MADAKSNYSSIANNDIRKNVEETSIKKEQYDRVKELENKYNNIWNKHKVDINDIIEKFTPGVKPTLKGYKLEYKNEKYHIKADIYGGYLRIFDRKTGKALKEDGTPGTADETHLKILKREEMN